MSELITVKSKLFHSLLLVEKLLIISSGGVW